MAFKFALFAALCIAQGYAFSFFDVFDEKKDNCNDPAKDLPIEFRGTVDEFDGVRDTVSAAALEAYGNNVDFLVVLACLDAQRENFETLGANISQKIRDAAEEIAEKLDDTADKYAEILKPPMTNITETLQKLPKEVTEFLKEKKFIKALEAMRNARVTVEANAKFIGEKIIEMAKEVPDVADLAEERAREIREEARKGVEEINTAFKKCVENGGPSKVVDNEENGNPNEAKEDEDKEDKRE